MTFEKLKKWSEGEKTETPFYFLSPLRVLIKWQPDFTESGGFKLSAVENDLVAESPFGIVVGLPNMGGYIPRDTDMDLLNGHENYSRNPIMKIGDVIMVRSQYKQTLRDFGYSMTIEGQEYFAYPLHDIVGIVKFSDNSLRPMNRFLIAESDTETDLTSRGVVETDKTFYKKSENILKIKYAPKSLADLVGKRVMVSNGSSSEHPNYWLWENCVKIDQKQIVLKL